MSVQTHMDMTDLESSLDLIRRSPKKEGKLALIVRRPQAGEREVVEAGELTVAEGLVGDNWSTRTPDAPPSSDTQLTIMNARVAGAISQDDGRWKLFGDQLYIDFEISEENLPVGARLALGTAIIEVTSVEHTGCKKFAERFGVDAVKFVSTPEGKALRLRGMYAKVVQPGTIQVGDAVRLL